MGDFLFALYIIGAVLSFRLLWRTFKDDLFNDKGDK